MREKLCIVSDRHDNIQSTIKNVYPEASHAFCMFHIINNIKANFKKNVSQIKELFMGAAMCYKIEEFERYILEIEKLDVRVKNYLETNGYQKWARVHSVNNRYHVMTSNIAESINAIIKCARELLLSTLLEYLRSLVQEWTSTNRDIARSTFKKLAKKPDQKLTENYLKSLKLKVISVYFWFLFRI